MEKMHVKTTQGEKESLPVLHTLATEPQGSLATEIPHRRDPSQDEWFLLPGFTETSLTNLAVEV